MFLKVGSDAFSAEATFLPPQPSAHTRRPLSRANIGFVVRTLESHEEIVGALSRRTGATVSLVDDGRETPFVVLRHSISQAADGSRWLHSVSVRQYEELSPSCLVMDGIEISPDRYSESERDGGIVVSLTVSRGDEPVGPTEQRLRSLWDGRYFELVRRGVEKRPRRVRCGRCQWAVADGRRVYYLNLIEAVVDQADPTFGFMRPELDNLIRRCAYQDALAHALIEQLRDLGVVSDAQVASMTAQAERDAADVRWELRRLVSRQGD